MSNTTSVDERIRLREQASLQPSSLTKYPSTQAHQVPKQARSDRSHLRHQTPHHSAQQARQVTVPAKPIARGNCWHRRSGRESPSVLSFPDHHAVPHRRRMSQRKSVARAAARGGGVSDPGRWFVSGRMGQDAVVGQAVDKDGRSGDATFSCSVSSLGGEVPGRSSRIASLLRVRKAWVEAIDRG